MIKNCITCNCDFLCKDNRSKYCHECKNKKEYYKEYNKKYRESNSAYFKEYRINNSEKIKETVKNSTDKWYRNGGKEIRKKYVSENQEFVKKIQDDWYKNGGKEKKSDYYKKNKEEIKIKRKAYRQTIKYKETKKEYYIKNAYKQRYRYILKGYLQRVNKNKLNNSINILGYNDIDFKIYIENKFLPDMNWNSNNFHIDHIIPIIAFKENVCPKVVNSLENLQPIYINENISKFTNLDIQYFNLYIKYFEYLNDDYRERILTLKESIIQEMLL